MNNATNNNTLTVEANGRDRFILRSKYRKGLVWRFKQAVDEAGGRRQWNPDERAWQVDARGVRAAVEVYEAAGWSVDIHPDAQTALEAPVPVEEPGGPTFKVTGARNRVIVQTPYNVRAVQAFRSVKGARWDRGTRSWSVPTDRAPALADAIEPIWADVAEAIRAEHSAQTAPKAQPADPTPRKPKAAPATPAPAKKPDLKAAARLWGIFVVDTNTWHTAVPGDPAMRNEFLTREDAIKGQRALGLDGTNAEGLPVSIVAVC